MVVQSVNLTECGELVRDLTIDAQEFDSRSVKRQSEMGNNTWVSKIKIVEIIPRWEKQVVFTENVAGWGVLSFVFQQVFRNRNKLQNNNMNIHKRKTASNIL